MGKSLNKFFSSCQLSAGLVFWMRLDHLLVSQCPKKFSASYFLEQIVICVQTICQHGQLLISCTVPSRLSFPPSHVYSCISFVQVCCIHWFHLCHHLSYTCYSFAYYYYYYYYCFTLLRVFHISLSWWFLTGVWVTENLLKSPGLFSVFWPISTML